MKKLLTGLVLLTLCLALLSAPASATEGAAPLNTDLNTFTAKAQAAGWTLPEGWTLLGFIEADFAGNGQAGLAALLHGEGGKHVLLTILQGVATQYPDAFPADGAGAAWGEFSPSLASGDKALILTIQGQGTDAYAARFTFTATEQHGFLLSEVLHQRWDAQTGQAMQNHFSLPQGRHTLSYGSMSTGAFQATSTQAEHSFTPGLYPIGLANFKMDGFPTDWDGFNWMLMSLSPIDGNAAKTTAKATSNATRQPTKKPSPTKTAEPAPGSWVTCPVCGETYHSGTWHQCPGNDIIVGGWVTCPVCGERYHGGTWHQCPGDDGGFVGGPVTCDVCGETYNGGTWHQCPGA